VDFIIKRDREEKLRYVALQSEAGRYIINRYNYGKLPKGNYPLPGTGREVQPGNPGAGNSTGKLDHPAYDAENKYDTLMLWEGGRFYYYSDAALRLAVYLRFPWNMLHVFRLVPVPVRDWLYRLIASNRYRWFGKKEVCRIPSAKERRHFPSKDDLQLEITLLESSEEG
jgi:predicted DCC family thiol-disulfide oxidoreductase YuxK